MAMAEVLSVILVGEFLDRPLFLQRFIPGQARHEHCHSQRWLQRPK
jgi:hypothetical protein